MSERDDTLLAFGGSVLLHAGIVAMVLVALWLKPAVQPLDVAGPVIEAVLVDFNAPPLPASASMPKPTPPKPTPPKPEPPPPPPEETMTPPPAQDRIDQEKVRLAAEALERAEREQEELRKQQQIDLDRQNDALAKMERERQKQLDDIRKQREEAERKRKLEEIKLAQLQERNKQADAEQQRALEQQRMDQLAAQEAQRAGTNGRDDSLKGQYSLAISQWADRNWRRPDTLQEGFRCMLTVKQIPGGDVIEVNSSRCSGDPLVIRSVEAAVQREPLPYRGFESVFERIVTIPFCYPREICIQ